MNINTKSYRNLLLSSAALVCLSLAATSLAASTDISAESLQDKFEEVDQSEKAFQENGRFFRFAFNSDGSFAARSNLREVPGSQQEELLKAAMGSDNLEGVKASYVAADFFGDESEHYVVNITEADQAGRFVILREGPEGFHKVFERTSTEEMKVSVFYLKDAEMGETLMLAGTSKEKKVELVTYDALFDSFLSSDEREEIYVTRLNAERRQNADAFISQVSWSLAHHDRDIKFSKFDDPFKESNYFTALSEALSSKDVLHESGKFIGSHTLESALAKFKEPIPFAGFKHYGERGAFFHKDFDPAVNPVEWTGRGTATGRFKIEQKTVAQFGYAVHSDASKYCAAETFEVNGKAMDLFAGERGDQSAHLSKQLPFPAGEFDFKMTFACNYGAESLQILFVDEAGEQLPSYDAPEVTVAQRAPLSGVVTTPAAVEVMNRKADKSRNDERVEQVELIDFSEPVRMGEFSDRDDRARKNISFSFLPKEAGLHHFNVRTASNVCRYVWGVPCLVEVGENVGWSILHPATKITWTKGSESRSNTQYKRSTRSDGFVEVYRGVRDNIIGVEVTEADIARNQAIDIKVETVTWMYDAASKSGDSIVKNGSNIVVVDAFGEANPAALWSEDFTEVDQKAFASASSGTISDMAGKDVDLEHSFMIAVREPSSSEFRPISAEDLKNQGLLKRKAIEVKYEKEDIADTSWLE